MGISMTQQQQQQCHNNGPQGPVSPFLACMVHTLEHHVVYLASAQSRHKTC